MAGKTALITGSTRSGIGATTAMVLASMGANIILNYGTGGTGREARLRAEELSKKIATTNPNVLVLEAAVDTEKEVKKLFANSVDRFGSVDILVNNAGGLWIEQDFAQIETRHWDQAVRTELDGTFYCIREALPGMRAKRWGRIVNVGLHHAIMEWLVNTQYGNVLDKYPYDFSIAKYAKQQFASLLALAEFKHGITINNVLPGIIETMDNERALEIIQGHSAQEMFLNPLDVAHAIVYLCSEEARGITQSDIRIPGNLYHS